MTKEITFILNGNTITVQVDPLKRLIDTLRDDLGLTGTKEGCGEGECGACSILADGKLINSCITITAAVSGCNILTIDGYRESERFGVMEKAFSDAGAVQCGFCTPGMLLAAEALLQNNPKPSEAEIREALSGNLCRCTGYGMIVKAIQLASERGKGLW